jgi:hypothetical protein
MKPDEFEQQLQSQPRRAIPSEWRVEILEAAHTASRVLASRTTRDATRVPWWREWLWPCPQAWAGLAAVWMILVALQITASSTPPSNANKFLDSEKQMAVAAQRRELARLLDVPADPAPASKGTVPGPRSESASLSKV